MFYISLNVQTTGLDPDDHQIIELAAILENTEVMLDDLPYFHAFVVDKNYLGSPDGLMLNKHNFEKIKNRKDPEDPNARFVNKYVLAEELYEWMFSLNMPENVFTSNKSIHLAGKNIASFDFQFLKRLHGCDTLISRINHSFIDPTMLYFDFKKDSKLPSTYDCWDKMGVIYKCNFKAMEVAKNTIDLLRKKY
ncbi:MAG: hypothetical protein WC783_02995 [Candidatus Paceibacterota bacterium]|jgi:hypothetical protein